MRNTFREWACEEKKKLSPMSRKERAQYIAEYYWLWILAIVCAVSFLGYLIYHAGFTQKEHWFYAVFANTNEDTGEDSELWQDFENYAQFDLAEKDMLLNSSSYFDPSISGGTSNSYFQSFVALVESGDLDCVTMRKEGIEALGTSGRLMDWSSKEARGIAETYKDRLLYAVPYDKEYSTEPVPIGIDLSDSLLVTRYHLYPEDCALGINAYTRNLDCVKLFLKFVLEED